MEPNFIYTPAQAQTVNQEIARLSEKPIQKYLRGEPLTPEDRQNFEQAIPLLDQLIKFDPTTINSYSLKGKILRALGRIPEAKVAFSQGLAITSPVENPDDKLIRSDLLFELAQIEFEARNYAEAQRAVALSIQVDDQSPAAHVLQAQLHQQNGKQAEAQESLLKALLLNPDFEPARVLFQKLNGPEASP